MQTVKDKYIITLNPFSRNLLLSAFSTCKFTMLHKDHPFSKVISEYCLIFPEHLDELFNTIKSTGDNAVIEFSIDDEILIYTALDITCKSYLTEIADDLQNKSRDLIEATGSDFFEVRNTLLKSCQIVLEGMRSSLNNHPRFIDRVMLLDTVLNVE